MHRGHQKRELPPLLSSHKSACDILVRDLENICRLGCPNQKVDITPVVQAMLDCAKRTIEYGWRWIEVTERARVEDHQAILALGTFGASAQVGTVFTLSAPYRPQTWKSDDVIRAGGRYFSPCDTIRTQSLSRTFWEAIRLEEFRAKRVDFFDLPRVSLYDAEMRLCACLFHPSDIGKPNVGCVHKCRLAFDQTIRDRDLDETNSVLIWSKPSMSRRIKFPPHSEQMYIVDGRREPRLATHGDRQERMNEQRRIDIDIIKHMLAMPSEVYVVNDRRSLVVDNKVPLPLTISTKGRPFSAAKGPLRFDTKLPSAKWPKSTLELEAIGIEVHIKDGWNQQPSAARWEYIESKRAFGQVWRRVQPTTSAIDDPAGDVLERKLMCHKVGCTRSLATPYEVEGATMSTVVRSGKSFFEPVVKSYLTCRASPTKKDWETLFRSGMVSLDPRFTFNQHMTALSLVPTHPLVELSQCDADEIFDPAFKMAQMYLLARIVHFSESAVGVGRHWKLIGTEAPPDRAQLDHSALAAALSDEETFFSSSEWAAFGIDALDEACYVSGRRGHYVPVSQPHDPVLAKLTRTALLNEVFSAVDGDDVFAQTQVGAVSFAGFRSKLLDLKRAAHTIEDQRTHLFDTLHRTNSNRLSIDDVEGCQTELSNVSKSLKVLNSSTLEKERVEASVQEVMDRLQAVKQSLSKVSRMLSTTEAAITRHEEDHDELRKASKKYIELTSNGENHVCDIACKLVVDDVESLLHRIEDVAVRRSLALALVIRVARDVGVVDVIQADCFVRPSDSVQSMPILQKVGIAEVVTGPSAL